MNARLLQPPRPDATRASDSPPPAHPVYRSLKPAEKAAVIIAALGPEGAEPLLRHFTEDDVRVFARASVNLADVPNEVVEKVIHEFVAALSDSRMTVNQDKLKALLASVLSDDAIERILEDLDDQEGRSIWEKLSASDSIDLANYLMREHPQTVAVVVSRIKPEAAARVMQRFDNSFSQEVIMRLSNIASLGGAVMDAVKASIEGDFLRGARLTKSKRKPDEVIGSIFNFLSSDKRDELLKEIDARSPSLAVAVQRKMFTFSDIPSRVDRASVSMIVREIENDLLIKALAFAKKNAPESKDFILGNISRRLSEQLAEQVADAPTPHMRDGEEAQFEIVGVIRKMAEKGQIELNQPDDDEAFEDD